MKYKIGDVFKSIDNKIYIITSIENTKYMVYYHTHYLENNELIQIGFIGGFWGECVIDYDLFLYNDLTILKHNEQINLFDQQTLDSMENKFDEECEGCEL
jgi:hypothetical protein